MDEEEKQRVLKETDFLYHHSNWLSSATNIKISIAEMESTVIGLQMCGFQKCLLEYLLSSNISVHFEMINRVRRNPLPFSDRRAEVQFKSLNISTNVQRWLVKIFTETAKFIEVLHAFLTQNGSDLEYFAGVIFPNICFHFMTREFDEMGCNMCLSLLDISHNYWPFCSTYLRDLPSFEEPLWKEFDRLARGRQSAWEMFDPFAKAFRQSLVMLSPNQKKVLLKVAESKQLFCKRFLGQLIRQSYARWHGDRRWCPGYDAFMKFLDFLETGSEQHFDALVQVIEGVSECRFVPPHWTMRNAVKTPIIVCPHDCLLLQQIFESDPVLKKSVIPSIRFREECLGNFEPRSTTIALTYMKSFSAGDPVHIFDLIEPVKVEKDQILQRQFLSFQQAVELPMREFYHLLYSDDRYQVSALISLETKRLHALKNKPEFRFYANCQFHESYLKQFVLLEEYMSRLAYHKVFADILKDAKRQLMATMKEAFGKLQHVGSRKQAQASTVEARDRKQNLAYAVVNLRTCFNVVNEATRSGKVLRASQLSSSGAHQLEKKTSSKTAMIMTGSAVHDVTRLLSTDTTTTLDRPARRFGRRFSVEGVIASSSNVKRLALTGLQKLAQPDSKVVFIAKLFDEFPGNDPQVQVLGSQYSALLAANRRKILLDAKACDIRQRDFELLAEQCQLFEARKRGSNMLELFDLSRSISQLSACCKDENGKKVPYSMCLTRFMIGAASSTIFEAYLWLSKVLFAFADFKTCLSPADQQAVNTLTANMKLSVQYLSSSMMDEVTQCSSSIFSAN